jgi:hypothetical protein
MALESPATYAEWYWAHSIDAANALAEAHEKELAPVISAILGDIPGTDILPPSILAYLNHLKNPLSPVWAEQTANTLNGIWGRIGEAIMGDYARGLTYELNATQQTLRITPDIANVLMLRKKITPEFWLARVKDGGYAKEEAIFAYESLKPYPTMPDIISYARYNSPIDSPKELAWSLADISESDWPLWEWLSRQKPTTEQTLSLYKRKYWTELETNTELSALGWDVHDRPAILDLAYAIPNPMLLAQGSLFQEFSKEGILDAISIGDIHPDYAQIYLDAILTKPSTQDLIAYELRKDPQLSDLDRQLRKIGIHPDYHALYKELAYQIPPIADIITMAVREAFTPDIAARFGQYEGLPSAFVEWVGKKGLSREWAERYWAAHWSLPSPQQGFEMLQRGVITRDDLYLLLRALDIMPFWRDKLIQISYNPLTRVDIRRMYALGVLSETEVNKAYQDIGYNTENAARLTLFTVKLTEQAKERAEAAKAKAAVEKGATWTTAQTLSFVKKGLIDRDRAEQELVILGYSPERISVYLASVTT